MTLNLHPYLYQSGSKTIEVVLTGRVAKRKTGRRGKVITLHEIESADKDLGFKEWVRLDSLFTIDENK